MCAVRRIVLGRVKSQKLSSRTKTLSYALKWNYYNVCKRGQERISRRLFFSLSLEVISAEVDGLNDLRAIPICHLCMWQPDGGRLRVKLSFISHCSDGARAGRLS